MLASRQRSGCNPSCCTVQPHWIGKPCTSLGGSARFSCGSRPPLSCVKTMHLSASLKRILNYQKTGLDGTQKKSIEIYPWNLFDWFLPFSFPSPFWGGVWFRVKRQNSTRISRFVRFPPSSYVETRQDGQPGLHNADSVLMLGRLLTLRGCLLCLVRLLCLLHQGAFWIEACQVTEQGACLRLPCLRTPSNSKDCNNVICI